MAYTPINWDELTPINPANLNKMDNAIDSNDNKLDGIDANGDGRVDSADHAISAGSAEFAVNADFADNAYNAYNADNAINADRLNGKRWLTIAKGNNNDTVFEISLKPGGNHHHYNISVFNTQHEMTHGADFSLVTVPFSYDDKLLVDDSISGGTTYYEVWSWE
jgi:hypothetical protein